MRLLHVLPSLDAGGLGSLALALIKAWPERVEHVVFAPQYKGTVPTLRPEFGEVVEIHRSMMDPMGFVETIASEVRGRGPFGGAIIYNFLDHVWVTMGLRRGGMKPDSILCHVGTILPPDSDELAHKMLSSPYTPGIRFIFPSKVVKDRLVALGAPKDSLGPVVWNGVDVASYVLARNKAAEERSHRAMPRFGFVGRMAPNAKDFPMLLGAFGDSMACRAGAQLHLMGDGPLRKAYEALAWDIGGIIQFHGTHSPAEVRTFLASLDVFVMAALPIEGMSIALVEAIATGLPIIATDVPANREVLHPLSGLKAVLVRDRAEMASAFDTLAFSTLKRGGWELRSIEYRRRFEIAECARAYYAELVD